MYRAEHTGRPVLLGDVRVDEAGDVLSTVWLLWGKVLHESRGRDDRCALDNGRGPVEEAEFELSLERKVDLRLGGGKAFLTGQTGEPTEARGGHACLACGLVALLVSVHLFMYVMCSNIFPNGS